MRSISIITSVIVFFQIIVSIECHVDQPGKKEMNVNRFASLITVKPEFEERYIILHRYTLPGVLEQIYKSNIRNYSIYLHELEDGKYYLFAYFEYLGEDFKADMEKMAADPVTQKWWELCEPCQIPLSNREEGQWWANMEEVFHTD